MHSGRIIMIESLNNARILTKVDRYLKGSEFLF